MQIKLSIGCTVSVRIKMSWEDFQNDAIYKNKEKLKILHTFTTKKLN